MIDLYTFIRKWVVSVNLLPELHQILDQLTITDFQRLNSIEALQVIPKIVDLFNYPAEQIAPFAAAWLTMYGAITHLDDVQDGDVLLPPFQESISTPAQYTIIFGYYLLAQRFLDLLDLDHFSLHRITRVRQFWTEMMLRMAGGQYRDLMPPSNTDSADILDKYQQLAQAKTGSTFMLAFGGTAMLLTDNKTIYESMAIIGEIYGTLLQYGDDINDAATQTNITLTLPHAIDIAQEDIENKVVPESLFPAIYAMYYASIEQHLVHLPPNLQLGIRTIFERTFTSPLGVS
jgi:hypothetical protein